MKKIFLSVALTIFAGSSVIAFAQTPESASLEKTKKECCASKECSKEKADMLRKGAKAKSQPRLSLMAGIDLTSEQKAKMEVARGKRDSKIKKAQADRTKKEKSIEESYQKELKKIMTPEQYQRYEANASKISKQREQITHDRCERQADDKHFGEKRKVKTPDRRIVTDSTARVGEMKPGPRPRRDYRK